MATIIDNINANHRQQLNKTRNQGPNKYVETRASKGARLVCFLVLSVCWHCLRFCSFLSPLFHLSCPHITPLSPPFVHPHIHTLTNLHIDNKHNTHKHYTAIATTTTHSYGIVGIHSCICCSSHIRPSR